MGPKRGKVLKKFGIETIGDLLYHFPRRYLDRTTIKNIVEIRVGDEAVIMGIVKSLGLKKTRRRTFFQMVISDGSGIMKCVWFNGISWISDKFKIGDHVAVFGKVEFYKGYQFIHPDFDIMDENEDPVNTGKILSLYPSTSELKAIGLESRGFRRIIRNAFDNLDHSIEDYFQENILKENALIPLNSAIRNIHEPSSDNDLKMAIFRLKFDEHFFMQLLMALRRQAFKDANGLVFSQRGPYLKRMYESLPFQLTKAQIQVMREIREDMSSSQQMNRLIQGDVGSGKTVVGMLTASIVIGHNAQVAFMAPTEILAVQHYQSLKKYCDNVGISVTLLKGGTKPSIRNEILVGLQSGDIQLVVGTHALIQPDVMFNDLGLIIVDEQHRFGVMQRKELIDKGKFPELLAMTATPIPRTLAITYHGDMDISIIDEMPKGRIPIKTSVVEPSVLEKVYSFMKTEIDAGHQCFVVYPLIEESEKMDLKAAESGYKKLNKLFHQYRVGYIHGKMKTDERDSYMKAFSEHEIDLLVSTTVIEVGIDIPNATIMLIENAERFGLSQLHQLRGRIGRGTHQSYCILIQQNETRDSINRLNIMSETNDGFKIADEDLKIRGPGDFFGTRQHGYLKTRLADLAQDGIIIRQARRTAFDIIHFDPRLSNKKNILVRDHFMKHYKSMLEFVNIG